MKNEFPILNYPGSKRSLLSFIDKHISGIIPKDKAVFDIFAGSGSVSYFYKDRFKVYANDSEKYSSVILSALLKFQPQINIDKLLEELNDLAAHNKGELLHLYSKWVDNEKKMIESFNGELEQFYLDFPNVWKNTLIVNNTRLTIRDLKSLPFSSLFTSYYSGSYFGISQAIEIDSIRHAIEQIEIDSITKNMLLSSLFYAMKEAVFSKDGHMAQPLGIGNNINRLINRRNISIYEQFESKLNEFYSDSFLTENKGNKVFNFTVDNLLKDNADIFTDVGFIYADPPYTDMQYSRYFHLLNTLIYYDYPEMTIYRGDISKGLYTENRYQSPLSQRSQAIHYHKKLFDFCLDNQIGLAFSFAYPVDPINQPTNRYVLNIFDLIKYGKTTFGANFHYYTQDYNHSNNRNSTQKRVHEYLLVYAP